MAEASTATQALELSRSRPELILLDVNLPDFDGFEACQKFREIPETSNVPIIHLSADHISNLDKIKGLDLGADGYLTHPTDPAVLIATVNAFLRARRAEDALRVSETRFKSIFSHALNGIAVFDREFRFVEVNPAFAGILDADRERLIGRWLGDHLAAPRDGLLEDIAIRTQINGTWRGDFPVRSISGRLVHLEWSVAKHSEEGAMLANVSDISMRVVLEQKRKQLLASERAARTEAERANRLKDEFLATVSHELRTPLTAIVGWAELLQFNPPAQDISRGLDVIVRNAKTQSDLIADLLDVARITSGKLRLDIEQVDLKRVCSTAVQTIYHAAESKNIVIAADFEAMPDFPGDSSRIQQALLNLLSNAVKFSAQGGVIRVQLRALGDSAEIRVEDTGRGIDRELLPFIFDRFRQGDGSTKRKHGGLGLGLAITKHIVELHGGQITATSDGTDHGATFIVCLPYGAAKHQQVAEASPDPGVRPAEWESLLGITVLIVEDDPDLREMVTRILRESKATVWEANSVDEALAHIRLEVPDVIVSDIGMPERDGYDFIGALREKFPSETLPALAMTAYAGSEDTRRLMDAGYQLHLVKPVQPAELIHAIFQYGSSSKASAQ